MAGEEIRFNGDAHNKAYYQQTKNLWLLKGQADEKLNFDGWISNIYPEGILVTFYEICYINNF